MMAINLNHLEAFCILAETLSFSKTAQLLSTSQPAISRKIKTLEDNLGYELFLRTNKQVQLSTKGMELKDRILPSYQHLISNITTKNIEERIVKIGSIYEAGLRLLIPVIGDWQKDNSLKIEMSFGSAEELSSKLNRGEIDFALIHRIPEQQSIVSHDVFNDQAILIGPKNSTSLSVVTYRQQDAYTAEFLKRAYSKKEIADLKMVASVNSHQAMIEMVRTGHYLAVIPQSSLSVNDRQHVSVIKSDSKRYAIVLCSRENYLKYPEHKREYLDLIRRIKKSSKVS